MISSRMEPVRKWISWIGKSGIVCVILVLGFVGMNLFSSSKHNSGIGSFVTSNGTEYNFPCVVSQPDAISSIIRAESDKCKIEIGNIACKSARGTLFPASIAHQCPDGNSAAYRSIGCFSYDLIKDTNFQKRSSKMTPKNCVDTCVMTGYRYAFLSVGHSCRCGNADPTRSNLEENRKCNKPCSGNPKQSCGGTLFVSVYETGLAKHEPAPIELEPKPGTKPVRIAFILMFHKRDIRQTRRLLGALYDRHHYYYIHVDARQHYLYREILHLEKEFPNVYVTRRRHSPVWGCYSLLQLLLSSFQEILSISSWQPDFITNISGSDFPIKSVEKLTKFLTANPARNFLVDQKIVPPERLIPDTGFNLNFVECAGRMWKIGERHVPTGITIRGGSDWFCLTKEFAQYVVNTNDDLVADLQSLMKYSGFGTESYFHILLYNSRFCQTHYDSNLRLISWKRGRGCSKSKVIDWVGCSPVCIRIDDFSALMLKTTDDTFIARKFNPVFDQTIILKLDEHILGKYPSNTPNLNSYWENVYHYQDSESRQKAAALSKVAYALVSSHEDEINFRHHEWFDVLEITHYFTRDAFYGFLIRYNTLVEENIVELELLVKPRDMFRRSYTQDLQVNEKKMRFHLTNELDVPEELPIDFHQVFSVDKSPILVVYLPTDETPTISENHTITVDWVNPYREVAFVDVFNISETPRGMKHHALTSNLQPPLAEGVWEAQISFNGTSVGIIEFLVTSNTPFPECFTCTRCQQKVFTDFFAYQCTPGETELNLRYFSHSKATIHRFFEIEKVCSVYEKTANGSPTILPNTMYENCYDTLWSTVAPDPKSDLKYQLERNRIRMDNW